MQQKSIEIDGRTAIIHGVAGDPYFETIEHYRGANEFLIRSVSTLPPNATIIDVGANIGLTALLFKSMIPSGRVICFEPDPLAYEALSLTVVGQSSISIHRKALGSTTGKLSFSQNPTSASASHLSTNASMADGNTVVDVVTLDHFAKTEFKRLDFIKVDVEGFESDVLKGASQTLEDYRPSVFVEFNSFTLIAFRNMNPRTLLDQLLETFPHIYCMRGSETTEIRDRNSQLSFLHDNLVRHGCVDDLFCRY
jgi:FkbM family methyltransferase